MHVAFKDDYGVEGKYPTENDRVPLQDIRGTKVFHYVAADDDICLASQADWLA